MLLASTTTLPDQTDIDPARFLPSSRSVAFRREVFDRTGGYPEWLDYCEDLLFDMARHVDSTVHQFEEWGLPIMKDPKTGRYLREGRWQIMIHGESYKPIVAEAAKKSADKVFNRI